MLSIRELYLALTATAAISASAMFWLHFSRYSTRGIIWWAHGMGAFFVSLVFMSLRGHIPPLISFVLANVLSTLGFVFIWQGIRAFLKRPGHPWVWGLSGILTAGVACFSGLSLIYPHLEGPRITMLCVALVLLNFFIARDLRGFGGRTGRLLALNYILNASIITFRGVRVVTTESFDVYYTTGWPTAAYVVWNNIFFLIMTLGLVTMIVEDLSNQLARHALEDPLTGLSNRRAFRETTPTLFRKLKSAKDSLGLLLLDIDFFKRVNDTHGHAVGDAYLVHFAREVAACLRSGDRLYRIGGEEFVALLPGLSREDLQQVALRICKHIEASSLDIENIHVARTVSIGASLVCKSDLCINTVLDRADAALYAAKDNGRNRVDFLFGV